MIASRKVRKVAILLGLSLAFIANLAIADENMPKTPGSYVKKATWQETMVASRARHLAHLETWKGIVDGVKLGTWHVTEPQKTKNFSQMHFDPENIDLTAKDQAGNLIWRPRPEFVDSVIHDLPSKNPASSYLFRKITAEQPLTITAGVGSNDGMQLWLNGKERHSINIGRQVAPNQDKIKLKLRQGENTLLMKVYNRTASSGFYFSLQTDPALLLWRQIEKDFPVQAGWMQRDVTLARCLDWFGNSDNTEIEQQLIRPVIAELGGNFQSLSLSNASADNPQWLELYAKLREQKSLQAVRNCPPIVFVKRAARARKGTNGTMLGQINRGAKMGSDICIYNPARPLDGVKTIFESKEGFIFDMSISYDAKKLLFSFMDNVKANVKEKKDSFHIWEINIDGTGLRQLTFGPFHDASAAYLPDGKIVFCSTRVQSFSLCQDFLAAAMYIMDAAGGNMRRIEYNTLCDTTPYIMDDGLVLFTRWEYQDKNIFCIQGLWTITPTGERLQLYYGNTLTIPNSICNAKQIPGTRKVLCVMAPHHGRPLGAIAIIDRSLGFENPKAIVSLTPEIPYTPRLGESWNYGPNDSWGPGDKQFDWAYGDPYPVNEDLFLVAYGGPIKGGPGRYRIYAMDSKGNKTCLYEDLTTSCYNPIPLAQRPLPHKFQGIVPEQKGEGTYFIADIYRGLVEKGVKRGQVKQLLVMSQVPKKYNTEGPRYHDHYPIMGQGSYYAKYCYGTVPVYEDGTAYFKVPAGVELYFCALDENGKEIRRMGTITQVTDGERQSCIGCHESRFMAAPPNPHAMKRLTKEPDTITPPPSGAGPVDFVKQIQPVFDKYCISCHSGRAPKAGIDLSGDKSRFYNMAYRSLVDRKIVEYYYINQAPTGNFPPFESGSWVSKLTKLIEDEHAGVKMADRDRRRIFNWIDGNAPYYGTWDMSRPYTKGGRDTWHRLKNGKRGKIEPEPWYTEFKNTFARNCSSCHDLKADWINLTNPEYSRVLNAHLVKDAGGMGLIGQKKDKTAPVFAHTNDPTYQALLKTIKNGKDALDAKPRMDMPGGVAVAQQRDFGKLY